MKYDTMDPALRQRFATAASTLRVDRDRCAERCTNHRAVQTMTRSRIVNRLATFVVAVSCIMPFSHAQTLEQWTGWGDRSMERGEYYGASRFYAGALEMDEGRMSLQWKMAEACRLSNQYDKAAAMYERIYRKDQGRTHPAALRWLGEMQMCLAQYDEAEASWNKLLERARGKENFETKRARNALAGCVIAREAMAAEPDRALEHPRPPLNTYDSEFGARFGPDSALYFTSLRGALTKEGEVEDTAAYRAALYRTTALNDTWSDPVALSSAGDAGQSANATWRPGGKWIFFTFCPDGGTCGIHFSPFNAVDLIPTPLEGLGPGNHTQPMIASLDGREVLFYASDAAGGEGGMDIWWARLEEGRAVDPRPLGPTVNTPGDERTPWFDAATSTLWYSSDFLPGMGGFDVFSSGHVDGTFAAPVHAGMPLNSPANDLYFALEPGGRTGWITSNRIGSLAAKGETCCNDLYRWQLDGAPEPPPTDSTDLAQRDTTSGTVGLGSEPTVTELLARPMKLYFHNDEPGRRSLDTTTMLDYPGTYQAYLALLPEYERQRPDADSDAIGAFFRDEVQEGMKRLETLVQALTLALEDGRQVDLKVRGHASPLAENEYNRRLSLRRIHSLENHLRRVDGGRLQPYLDGMAGNGGRLRIVRMPFGEERSAAGVSDRVDDTRHSIHSVAAARERRIEIESVMATESTDVAPPSGSMQQIQRLGQMRQGEEREVPFVLRNNGPKPLRLLHMEAECGCTTSTLPMEAIPAGGSTTVTVRFNGKAPTGPLERSILIHTDGDPATIRLTLKADMTP